MDKIVISTQELGEVKPRPDEPPRPEPMLPPVIPWWVRVALAPLVLVMPLLGFVAIILRVATRNQPPRIKHGWTAFLSSLLIVSGFITSAAAVLTVAFVPIPAIVSSALSDLDDRTTFPGMPMAMPMSGSDVSTLLKPLVAVITPARRTWFSNQESPAFSLGAGILLRANSDGYLFATAHHVVDGENWRDGKNSRALVAMASGVWAGADVIARHKSLDLALLWIPRQAGHAEFVQPITAAIEGEPVFVIGHPKGLKFTLSNGMVSRREPEVGLLQISAPVSPGNSGGPVFDDRGNLIGIVVSQAVGSDAQNLNFAVGAEALLQDAGWSFSDGGKQRFAEFSGARERQNALHRQPAPARAVGSRNQEN